MRQVGWAILIVLLIHLLAVAGGAAWLAGTGRISRDRLEAVVATFRVPIAEEKAREAQAAIVAAEARELAVQAAKLESVADGPQTLNDRFSLEVQKDEIALHRLERLKRETDDLRSQIERAQEILADQKADLEADRQAFERFVQETTAKLQDEDFQRAVQTYEQLKPRQSKEMFQQLLAQGQMDQVVDYLAAMQLRKSAAVLKEFETPDEVLQATQLVEELRQRGIYTTPEPVMAEATP